MCYSARNIMKLGRLLNRVIYDLYAKFCVSSYKNVITITADAIVNETKMIMCR